MASAAQNGASEPAWEGGQVLFSGGTDWALLGRSLGSKKKTDADKAAEQTRLLQYPALNVPHQLKGLQDIKVRFVASGSTSCHCMFGDMNGKLYTWGRNEKGQLGHGDLRQRNVPTIVEGLQDHDIIAAAGGRHHSVVVTAEGQAFAFGSNLQGQCGTGSIKSQPKSEELIQAPVQCAAVEGCSAVAAGAEFTMWLCQGQLWSAGGPQHGVLGHGTDHEYNAKDSSVKLMYEPQPKPARIAKFTDMTIRAVACGSAHTVALNNKGEAFSWGDGGYGRLGHSVQQDEMAPRQIETFRGRMPVDPHSVVAAGSTSSFCSMVGPQLCAWGKLKASGDNTMYPKPFQDLSGWTIRSMACGNTTFAVAAEYQGTPSTITWGQASYGELAYGENGKKSSANPEECPSLKGVYVQQVAAGMGQMLFLVRPSEQTKKFPEFEPETAVEEGAAPAEPAAASGKGKGKAKAASAGKARGAAAKRKAEADDEPKPKAKGRAKKK